MKLLTTRYGGMSDTGMGLGVEPTLTVAESGAMVPVTGASKLAETFPADVNDPMGTALPLVDAT